MNKKALSLLEILVSITLLAIIMSGLINVFVSSKWYLLHSRWRLGSGELARYFLDPLQMQVNEAGWGNNCLSNSDINCSTTSVNLGISFTAQYNITNLNEVSGSVGNDLRKVKVAINWSEPNVQ